MIKKILILALLFSFSFGSIEDKIKSQFVGKISSLIKWPQDKIKDDFLIGVYGSGKIINELENIYIKKKIKGKPVKIQQTTNLKELIDKNVIFISSGKHKEIIKVINFAKKHNILTMSDTKGFIDKGGIIQLFTVSRKMKIKVNNTVAKESKLEIKSILLRLAKEVK